MSKPAHAAPTAHPQEPVRILPVPLAGPIVVLFAGDSQGLLVHRHQDRPHACPGATSCPPTLHRSRTLWYGYAPVYAWRPGREDWLPGVLEITEALDELLRGRKLRGELWMLERSPAKRKTGPVGGVLLESRGDLATPPAFDILPPLQRLYHALDLAIGVVNPMPRRLSLPAAQLAPPPGPASFGLAEPPRPTEKDAASLRRLAAAAGGLAPKSWVGGNGHEK